MRRDPKEAREMKKMFSLWLIMFPLCRIHDVSIIHSSTSGSFPATVAVVWITGMQRVFVVEMESFGYESGVVQLGIQVGVHLFL